MSRSPARAVVAPVITALAILACASTARAYVYWSNMGSTAAGGTPGSTIMRANLDGSGQTTLVTANETGEGTTSHPCGVSIAGGSLYWGNDLNDQSGFTGRTIGEAPIGGGPPDVFTGLGGSGHFNCGVATDGTYLYIALDGENQAYPDGSGTVGGDGGDIARYPIANPAANPDVFFTETVARNPGDLLSSPCGIAVDATHIYWADRQHSSIGRMDLDGSNPDPEFIHDLGTGPCGVAVDSHHVYWSNVDGQTGTGTTIGRANLDGTGVDNAWITGADGPCGVAVDPGHLYWANFGTQGSGATIGRATLTATGDLTGPQSQSVNQAFIAINGSQGPCGVAVDSTPGGVAGSAPQASTGPASAVTETSATLTGYVNPRGSATTYHFQFGTTTAYGRNVPATDASAGAGAANVPVSTQVTGLTKGTTYHYRLVAHNASGTTYGSDVMLVTRAYTLPATSDQPVVRDSSGAAVTQAQIGATLTCDPPSFTADAGDQIALSYHWTRAYYAAKPATIDGATGQSYTLTGDDERDTIKCEVDATDSAGTVTLSSAGVTAYSCDRPEVDGFTPTSGHPPQGAEGGTIVHITGQFFCPGDQVSFGGGDPVPASDVSADGTSLRVQVPISAAPGYITVADGGSVQRFEIAGFRWMSGFRFPNYSPFITFDDAVNAFGRDRAYTGQNCGSPTCSPDQPELRFVLFAAWLHNWLAGGACFGFSLGAERILLGQRHVSEFPSATNLGDTFGLDGDSGPSAPLRDYIQASHVQQASVEYQSADYHEFQAEAGLSPQDASKYLYDRVNGVLRANRYPMISMFGKDAAGDPVGHEVVAYSTEGTPDNWYIDVYDSNQPGSDHDASSQTTSRIHIVPAHCFGSKYIVCQPTAWTLPSTGLSGDQISQVTAVDPLSIPMHPTPDWALDSGLHAAVGTVIGGAASTSGGQAPRLVQVTDAHGRKLLGADGLPSHASGSLPGALAPPSVGGQPSGAPLVLLPGDTGPVTEQFTDSSSGAVQQVAFTRSLSALVTTPAATNDKQTLQLNGDGVAAGAGSRGPLTIALSRPVPGGSELATLSAGSAPGDLTGLAFGPNDTLQVSEHGRPGNGELTLTGPDGTQTVHVRLHIGTGTTHVAGIDWHALIGSRLHATEHGHTLTLKARSGKPGPAAVGRVVVRRSRHRLAVTVVRAARPLPAESVVTFGWRLRRGGRVVGRGGKAVPAPARRATFTLPATAGSGAQFTASITVTAPAHGGVLARNGYRTVRIGR